MRDFGLFTPTFRARFRHWAVYEAFNHLRARHDAEILSALIAFGNILLAPKSVFDSGTVFRLFVVFKYFLDDFTLYTFS